MCLKSCSLKLSSQENTLLLAQTIAPLLKAGDIILLEGPIGAGKSFFARSLILSLLTEPEDIPSPTFTLVQTYDAPKFEIWHCDLYRLTTPYEAQELGLEDAFETALCIVEWPDRLGDLTPPNALTIKMETTNTPDERLLNICTTNPHWASVLKVINDKS
jgi:tRNA threonylcarbamoyladenosine biosynthesis protein TsaE